MKQKTPAARRSQVSSRLRHKRHTTTYTNETKHHAVTPAILRNAGQQMNGHDSILNYATPSGRNSVARGATLTTNYFVDAGTNPVQYRDMATETEVEKRSMHAQTVKPVSRARSRRRSIRKVAAPPVEVLEEEVKREDREQEVTPPRQETEKSVKETSSERKRKLVYLPYLLPAADKSTVQRVGKPNEDLDLEEGNLSLKKPIDPTDGAKKKQKHHKSKDKCPICIAKRAKREAERKEREQLKQQVNAASERERASIVI